MHIRIQHGKVVEMKVPETALVAASEIKFVLYPAFCAFIILTMNGAKMIETGEN